MNKTITAVSLALNIALSVAIWFKPTQPPSASTPIEPSLKTTSTQKSATQTNIMRVVREETFHWADVQTEDFEQYANNLRAIGCPEETVRDIVTGELNDRYVVKRQALYQPLQSQFWELAARDDDEAIERVAGDPIRKLKEEKEALLHKIFPRGVQSDFEYHTELESELRDVLSDTQKEQMNGIIQRYAALRRSHAHIGSIPESERTAHEKLLKKLEDDFQAEQKALLTPEQAAEWEMRRSDFAKNNREIFGLETSEAELKAIAEIYRTVHSEGKNAGDGLSDVELEKLAQSRIKDLFGEERYDVYNQSKTEPFVSVWKVAERFNLENQKVAAAAKAIELAERRASELQSNITLPADQRDVELDNVWLETRRSIQELLGETPAQILFKNDNLIVRLPEEGLED